MASELALRPSTPDDRPFLEHVYASTRSDELAAVPWSDAQKAAFLHMQFQAQDAHYRAFYIGARFDVILLAGQPVGRLIVQHDTIEIRLLDIALLPEHRGAGIGSRLIGELIEQARADHKPLSIYVERFNPAQRLYQRLGFLPTGEETGVYFAMQWRAERQPNVLT